MRFAVVVFPGSNCEQDTHHVLQRVMGQDVDYVWYATPGEGLSPGLTASSSPGFAYGDTCGWGPSPLSPR